MNYATSLFCLFVIAAAEVRSSGAEPPTAEVRTFQETKAQAEAGDVDAQYKLAGLYSKGTGTPKDDAAAVQWYRKVAEQNDRRGQSMLAVMYTNARGVPRDYDRAIELFRRAAAQNSAHAQYNLGHMYATGKGVPQDEKESADWYRKAARQGDVGSQSILASLYAAGRGVPQDFVQAYAWTKVAAATGNAPSQQELLKYAARLTTEQRAEADKVAGEITAAAAAREPVAVSYGKDPKQSLNVYRPSAEAKPQPVPVVVWVHGGGWRNGDKDNRAGINLCRTWADQGFVVVGLDYRLTPAVVHPAHIEDVASGIAWIHEHIAEYGGDPQRVFLLGHSAGAHLVALAATAPKYLQAHKLTPKSALAGVMSIDTASYDLTTTQAPLVKRMVADAFGADPQTLKEASPLLHARRNPDAVPPLVIAVVKQRPDAVGESKALNAALPNSTLIVVDYPDKGQLAAHGLIAKDLIDFDKDMGKRLLAFVKNTPASAK